MEVLMYEASAQSDALIYLDCDFTYPPDVIPQIRKILESGVDVVNAARTRTRPEAMPLPNYLANKSFALLAQATAGPKVADLHSGMRGYRSSLTRAFAFDGEGDAFFASVAAEFGERCDEPACPALTGRGQGCESRHPHQGSRAQTW